jgi:hypothetical protein
LASKGIVSPARFPEWRGDSSRQLGEYRPAQTGLSQREVCDDSIAGSLGQFG